MIWKSKKKPFNLRSGFSEKFTEKMEGNQRLVFF